jgi:hypothetical protein
MRWPWVSRAKYEAALVELETERKRARRRERRRVTATVPLANGAAPLMVTPITFAPVETVPDPDIPAEVLEAIELRAGGLGTRTGAQMLKQASKALKSGAHVGAVVKWMIDGEAAE